MRVFVKKNIAKKSKIVKNCQSVSHAVAWCINHCGATLQLCVRVDTEALSRYLEEYSTIHNSCARRDSKRLATRLSDEPGRPTSPWPIGLAYVTNKTRVRVTILLQQRWNFIINHREKRGRPGRRKIPAHPPPHSPGIIGMQDTEDNSQ